LDSRVKVIERFFCDPTPKACCGAASSNISNSSYMPSETTSTSTTKPQPFIWTAKATDILEKATSP